MTAIIDTNIFIYLFAKTPLPLAERSKRFLERIQQENKIYTVTLMTIAEIVWVSEKGYTRGRHEIATFIRAIMHTKNIDVLSSDIISLALILYETKNIDFIDAYHVAFMQANGIEAIYSFDKHFDRISTLKRLEPLEYT